MPQSPRLPRRVKAAEKRARAMELRKAGATYEQIGQQLGMTKQSAYETVTIALRQVAERTSESASEVIQLELARLDQMLVGLWGQARQGDMLAVDRVLRIMERRARLLGLDAEGAAIAQANVTVEVAWPAPDPDGQPDPLIIEGETL